MLANVRVFCSYIRIHFCASRIGSAESKLLEDTNDMDSWILGITICD